MTIWDRFPCDGVGITCDKLPKERALMTVEQAREMLRIAAKYKKGTIPEEFLSEAAKVLNENTS
jgi:hypothetical protein